MLQLYSDPETRVPTVMERVWNCQRMCLDHKKVVENYSILFINNDNLYNLIKPYCSALNKSVFLFVVYIKFR